MAGEHADWRPGAAGCQRTPEAQGRRCAKIKDAVKRKQNRVLTADRAQNLKAVVITAMIGKEIARR